MLGLQVRDGVLELREHVLGDVAFLVGEPQRVVPLVERIVDSHVQAAAPSGLHEVERDVAFGADIHGVPGTSPGLVGLLVAPQSEAFVVLRGERDVFGAGALEDVGPVVRIVELGAEHRGEIEVGKVGAVDAIVEFAGGRIRLVE